MVHIIYFKALLSNKIRREEEEEEKMGNEKQAKIPVIDFSDLQGLKKSETASNWVSVSKEVCHALEEYGCFVVTLQDKDCLELHHKIFDSLDELFNFPKQVKVENKYDKPFRGYHSPFPFHEGFGIDDAINPESTRNFTTLFWPNGNNHFWYQLLTIP